jgi:hypothetical protein
MRGAQHLVKWQRRQWLKEGSEGRVFGTIIRLLRHRVPYGDLGGVNPTYPNPSNVSYPIFTVESAATLHETAISVARRLCHTLGSPVAAGDTRIWRGSIFRKQRSTWLGA